MQSSDLSWRLRAVNANLGQIFKRIWSRACSARYSRPMLRLFRRRQTTSPILLAAREHQISYSRYRDRQRGIERTTRGKAVQLTVGSAEGARGSHNVELAISHAERAVAQLIESGRCASRFG
jgi:hypothetical protein